jgi:hypothetical protein
MESVFAAICRIGSSVVQGQNMLHPSYILRRPAMVLALYVSCVGLCNMEPSGARAAGEGADVVLEWNAIALEAVIRDHSGTFGPPEQGGPTRASRALAIVHLAMFDAANAIDGTYEPYLPQPAAPAGASVYAAVAQAARDTLVAI